MSGAGTEDLGREAVEGKAGGLCRRLNWLDAIGGIDSVTSRLFGLRRMCAKSDSEGINCESGQTCIAIVLLHGLSLWLHWLILVSIVNERISRHLQRLPSVARAREGRRERIDDGVPAGSPTRKRESARESTAIDERCGRIGRRPPREQGSPYKRS
jgi:hypothetical protein